MSESNTANDLSFPQKDSSSSEIPNPLTESIQRQAGPNHFRDGENIKYQRVESVESYQFLESTVTLKVQSSEYINRTTQTHDTVMHQFLHNSDVKDSITFEITFFTAQIFRIKFSADPGILEALTDDPDFPSGAARMLVGASDHPKVQFKKLKESTVLACPGIRFSSSAVSLYIQFEPFLMKAYHRGDESAPFWTQRLSDLFTSDIVPTSIARDHERIATFEAFSLSPLEQIFGLGERFDSVSRRGRVVDFVNHDAIGTSNTRSYINIPFFWSTRGYGCFLNSTARTEWDVGVSEAATLGFSVEEPYMDYFVIQGQDGKEILQQYTAKLTGLAPLPPIWTFGVWLSRNSYASWKVVDGVIDDCREHGIPVDDVHLDTSWFHEDWNPDYDFDEDRFANPEQKMAQLKEDGIHVSVWQYSFFPAREDNQLYREGRDRGYFGMQRLENGKRGAQPFKYPEGTKGSYIDDAVIDFSNPKACEWYTDIMVRLIRQGVSAIKTDFGDCIPADAFYDRIEGKRFQNLYSLVYNAVISSAIRQENEYAIVWARGGTAGSQRFPIHWGGDSQCSWSGLQGSLRATLSAGLSGIAYFSHDIGGFIGRPSDELYIRWAQVVLLSSHSRSHGAGDDNGREPWLFGDTALAVFKKFARMRYQLLPYIVEQARLGGERGLPVVRSMVLEFPRDLNTRYLEHQYMLGGDILVAPVLQPRLESRQLQIYLPEGVWFDFWTKQRTESSGKWICLEDVPIDMVAMWVRSGTMLVWAKERERTFNVVGEVETVELYGDRDGAWTCGIGDGGSMITVTLENEEYVCDGLSSVTVSRYQ